MSPAAQSWAAVVPVKRLPLAKTRIALPADLRAELALAIAADTVAACRATSAVARIVVVTDDEDAAARLAELGAVVVPDAPDAGLNPALRHGAAFAAVGEMPVGVVALSSDLPALTAADLGSVLERAGEAAMSFVADAAGTGTTLLAARSVDLFDPQFGPDSAQRHRDVGAVDLSDAAGTRVRRDVDTLADLMDAVRLGCGPAVTALLAAHPDLLRRTS